MIIPDNAVFIGLPILGVVTTTAGWVINNMLKNIRSQTCSLHSVTENSLKDIEKKRQENENAITGATEKFVTGVNQLNETIGYLRTDLKVYGEQIKNVNEKCESNKSEIKDIWGILDVGLVKKVQS